MILLSVDQSLNSTGAVLWNGSVEEWRLFKPPKGLETVIKIRWIIDELRTYILQKSIEYVVIESLPYGANSTSVRPLAALYYFIYNLCLDLQIPFAEANVSAVKKHATGFGKAKKEQMIEQLRIDNPKLYKEIVEVGVKKTTGLADLADAYFIGKFFNDRSQQ